MKNEGKIDAIKMTRDIRNRLYKLYQASPEEYYKRLHEGFKEMQEKFGTRTHA
jgi:N-methylhydantoinase A/oxoprolinase/acetone carboxylase beta subunit